MPEDARIDLNPRHFRCRESLLGGSYVQKRKSRAPSKAADSELDPDDWDAFYAPCMFTATDGSRHVELGPTIVPNEMPAPPAKRHAATAQAVPPPPPPPPSASPPTTTPPTPALSGVPDVSPTAVPTEWPGAWPVELQASPRHSHQALRFEYGGYRHLSSPTTDWCSMGAVVGSLEHTTWQLCALLVCGA